MKVIELAKEIFPDASPEEAGWIVWNRTAFPFDDAEGARRQLLEVSD